MDRIPVDLYRQIVSYVERKSDLANLTQVNRDFNAEAEPILWHEIKIIGDHQAHNIMISTRNTAMCELLSTNQAKADLVAEVSIFGVGPIWQVSDNVQLSAIAALRHISLMRVDTDDFGWMSELTDPYESLRHFTCWQPDKNAISFINRQPKIHTINICGRQNHIDYDDLIKIHPIPSAPYLESINAYSDLIIYFVPGNPVKSVNITTMYRHQSSVETLISACGLSTEPLERLRLEYPVYNDVFKAEHISLISQNAPDLQELIICFPLGTHDMYRQGGTHAGPYIKAITRLKKLKVILFGNIGSTLHDQHGKWIIDLDEHTATCKALAKAIMEACPWISLANFYNERDLLSQTSSQHNIE